MAWGSLARRPFTTEEGSGAPPLLELFFFSRNPWEHEYS